MTTTLDIGVLGLNHRTAPVEFRERVAFQEGRLADALGALRRDVGVPECVILSTCNRVELYTALPATDGMENRLTDFLARFHGVDIDSFRKGFYWYGLPDSVRHL